METQTNTAPVARKPILSAESVAAAIHDGGYQAAAKLALDTANPRAKSPTSSAARHLNELGVAPPANRRFWTGPVVEQCAKGNVPKVPQPPKSGSTPVPTIPADTSPTAAEQTIMPDPGAGVPVTMPCDAEPAQATAEAAAPIERDSLD